VTADLEFLRPDWPVADNVHAAVTTRAGGFSQPPYASFNLATHVGDDVVAVERNRQLLRQALQLPQEPRWLEQVHGVQVVDAGCESVCQADAAYTDQPGQVCVVLTADCLPVFIADRNGTEVAVAHAGWKGLQAGVIEATLDKFRTDAADLCVWLGPAIGPAAFEVGAEVVEAFVSQQAEAQAAFQSNGADKWLADIYQLARLRLQRCGVGFITGGEFCTVSDQQRFYSYRRDGVTGRMASLIWFEELVEKHSE
jgi:YfiH family protein